MNVFDFAIEHCEESNRKLKKKNEEEKNDTKKIDVTPIDFLPYVEAYRVLLKLRYKIIEYNEIQGEEWSMLRRVNLKERNIKHFNDLNYSISYLKKIIYSYIDVARYESYKK